MDTKSANTANASFWHHRPKENFMDFIGIVSKNPSFSIESIFTQTIEEFKKFDKLKPEEIPVLLAAVIFKLLDKQRSSLTSAELAGLKELEVEAIFLRMNFNVKQSEKQLEEIANQTGDGRAAALTIS